MTKDMVIFTPTKANELNPPRTGGNKVHSGTSSLILSTTILPRGQEPFWSSTRLTREGRSRTSQSRVVSSSDLCVQSL